MGHDQRLGVGHQPHHRLPRDRRAVDAKRIAIYGHSRLGKTVLWASARDERIAAVFSSCAGEMGSALARRDWGETVDDMAQNFPWQFAGNFQKWAGRWNEMPVDAHMLIALSAPRPVFVTGGTTDQWADPVGRVPRAMVAAGPVYRLLGKKDLGVTELPPLDTPLTARRSRLALPHRRPHRDTGRLAGLPRVSGQVFRPVTELYRLLTTSARRAPYLPELVVRSPARHGHGDCR